MKQISHNVYKDGNKIYTKARIKKKIYGEKILGDKREWDPKRSKLGAAVLKGLKVSIKDGDIVLYLGASTGTTVSHVSDIVGNGYVYGIEFAERVFRSLVELAKDRKNIAALKEDARKMDYSWIEQCDVVFCDIADPQQTDIAIRNAKEFLKKNGLLLISVKSQSIDVTMKPKDVYEKEKKKVEKAGFSVIQLIDLEPYEEKHTMIVAQK